MNELVILSSSICLCILTVILIGLGLQRANQPRTRKKFAFLVAANILFVVNAILCEVFESIKISDTLSYIFNLFSFIFIDLISLAFLNYLRSLLTSKKKYKAKFAFVGVIVNSTIRIFAVIVLSLFGYVFAIENGVYVEKDFNFIPYIFTTITLINFLIIIMKNDEFFSTRQMVVMILYETIPIPAVLIELFYNQYYVINIALTVSVLLIYILIQDTAFEENKIKQALLEEVTTKDFMTGLLNRRSYYERMQSLGSEELIGIVFCDLNGLKAANDSYGHAYGDKLIQKFADMLKETFSLEDSFRISGDEFVVIKNIEDSDAFYESVEKFKDVIKENDYIAACGYTYGRGKAFESLVAQAESKMYEHKFHKALNRKK